VRWFVNILSTWERTWLGAHTGSIIDLLVTHPH